MLKLLPDVHEEVLKRTAIRCRERGIQIPTFAQMENPDLIPQAVRDDLKGIGLWDVHPRNLFRVSWKNEPVERGGLYAGPNYLEIPRALTGTKARIIGLVGKWFPTGAHKVGATFGCLVPRLVTGNFDPVRSKAVWPSTGNYCRGGAYVSNLLSCESIAILPEEMSEERFTWLKNLAGEVIATPGSESNVKEIFDACHTLKEERDDVVIFNQFEELGNHLWHYRVTGRAMLEVLEQERKNGFVEGVVLSSGSAGTLGAADRVKEVFPGARIGVAEALQCPTLLENGFGAHRIEGIGDKHVPWIHNVRNTDTVIGVDDDIAIRAMRLFNEDVGKRTLKGAGIDAQFVDSLNLFGISSICNILAAMKFAEYYELDETSIVLTVFTDSMELYGSRMSELKTQRGTYSDIDAAKDWEAFRSTGIDYVQDLGYRDRKRIHNLKYFTWVEQQERELAELNRQWYDYREYWGAVHQSSDAIDEAIDAFNERSSNG